MVSGLADEALRYRSWLEGLIGVPATEGNHIQVLRNGDQIFPAMLEAIRGATLSIDLSTFIFDGAVADEFALALAERARAGIRVRVLLDAIGTGAETKTAVARMRQAGATVELFRPATNPRL